ncbi:MAG: ComEC/Rec2 family competence protein [Patescibacteria group bacterium]
MIYGDIVGLPDEVKDWFQRTGTLHLVAVSGSNVVLVTDTILVLLIALGLNRKAAFYFLLVALFLFVILTGADASVVRAGFMGALFLTAKQIGRPSASLSLFLLTMAAMVALSPRLLLDDIGFRLSFAAVAGIMWLAPKIKKYFSFIKYDDARTLLSETFAAIIATLPFSVISFGTVSLIAPIANLLILPVIPAIMIVGAAFLIMSAASRAFIAVPILIWLPIYAVLEYIFVVVRLLSRFPVWRIGL